MRRLVFPLVCLNLALAGAALAGPVTFTALPGLLGTTNVNTVVFKADLSTGGVGSILGLIVQDSNSGVGGSAGQFSGFDLDAIKISNTDCADAACVAAAPGLNVFDFAGGMFFSPGTQRAPADAKLFGTGAAGNTVDLAMATLASFDANSTTDASAAGFVSLGDGGALFFNLTAAVNSAGAYLYIGEVGNNGEVAAGNIRVLDTGAIPEPGTFLLLGGGLAIAALLRRRA